MSPVLCLRCYQYAPASRLPFHIPLVPLGDPEMVARDFASAVNRLRWDSSDSGPKDDGTWVAEKYYAEFFLDYSTIFYTHDTHSNESWIDFPAIARARVQAQQRYRDLSTTTGDARPKKTWWFGSDGNAPTVAIEHVDPDGRFLTARYEHWREWGDTGVRGTGGTIRCHLVVVKPHRRTPTIRVVRYWHDWLPKDGALPTRDSGITAIVNELRQRAVPHGLLAPMRDKASQRVCVLGANEQSRTHLLVEAVNKRPNGLSAVFVGRVAGYPFETLMQLTLRTALHYPVCFAEVSCGSGTALEVDTLVAAGVLVCAFAPAGQLSTQFLRDYEIYRSGFRLFTYDWPRKDKHVKRHHVESLNAAVASALAWSAVEHDRRVAALDAAYPWRKYERLPPSDAIAFAGECQCR